MEQEVNIKVICITTQSAEKVAHVFTNALREYMHMQKGSTHISKQKNVEHKGKIVKVKDLRKDGSQVECVDMDDEELKRFRKFARRYGVSYSMEKNKETAPPTYNIFFKATDSTLINKAISDYVVDKIEKGDKENGIVQKLIAAKEKMGIEPKKVRNKEQIR
ncbi:MAG: PcfB family protein [Lachnospiraceae bacterium]|nr:PcfB family protein [Lachnospiraceae bacterium]